MTALSILELGRVREGFTRGDALHEARRLAQHAEALGYKRFWVAEHHNMAAVTTAATSLVISHIAAGTRTIRVGAGGIMLPNHAPYVIAEQFGTLVSSVALVSRCPSSSGCAVAAKSETVPLFLGRFR